MRKFGYFLLVIFIILVSYIFFNKTIDKTRDTSETTTNESFVSDKNDFNYDKELDSSSGIETDFDIKTFAQNSEEASTDLNMSISENTTIIKLVSQNNPTIMAWLYPGEPGCAARTEYKDGRKIDVLKPEFFTINGGSLILLDTKNSSCNGFSKSFAAELKKYSNHQYITVSSASAGDMNTFLTSPKINDDIQTLVNFVVINGFTGIELDFEDFGGWSKDSYIKYKSFVATLGAKLHNNNKKLMLDGPAIANKLEQDWFQWRYEDFASLPVDYVVIMAYDYQFDHGPGMPVAPLTWISDVTKWVINRLPSGMIVVGIPSYGYHGKAGNKISILTYEQMKLLPGFEKAKRDPVSHEMTWKNGNDYYFYQDEESIAKKIGVVTDLGISAISIWHIGGNKWF